MCPKQSALLASTTNNASYAMTCTGNGTCANPEVHLRLHVPAVRTATVCTCTRNARILASLCTNNVPIGAPIPYRAVQVQSADALGAPSRVRTCRVGSPLLCTRVVHSPSTPPCYAMRCCCGIRVRPCDARRRASSIAHHIKFRALTRHFRQRAVGRTT